MMRPPRAWFLGGQIAIVVLVSGLPQPGFSRAADLDCLIESYVQVAISSPVEGVIERVTVDRGASVKVGQVLVELESSVEKAAVVMAKIKAEMLSPHKSNQVRLEFGERRFNRTVELYRKDLIPMKEYDEAETAKALAEVGVLEARENEQLARAELVRAEAAYALRSVRSPINGVVVERLLAPGEFAKQAPILKLAQLDPLRVEVIAPVQLWGQIAVGMAAQIMPEAPVKGSHRARVTIVDRVIDAASGTFGVRLELPNPNLRLPAGLKCTVRFER
jgi:RND family efflux transporter MFP subunit